ncbi:uncharacterized protein LOC135482656 [Lineus longissimus]|uniref:uncharacterized protein LOC135482656 n=1 Tax=Lineus longissimus TaxID=88925 RepID=UPI00315D6CBF
MAVSASDATVEFRSETGYWPKLRRISMCWAYQASRMVLTRRRRYDCQKPGITKRRDTFFKKGHVPYKSKVDFRASDPGEWLRLPLDLYNQVTTKGPGGTRIVPDIHNRPSASCPLRRSILSGLTVFSTVGAKMMPSDRSRTTLL